MRVNIAMSMILSGCERMPPTNQLAGSQGFTVRDALLTPCQTAAGEWVAFGLVRSATGCGDQPPRRRTCAGFSSLLAYPFACQPGTSPIALTADHTLLVWVEDITDPDDLSTAQLRHVEHWGCGDTPLAPAAQLPLSGEARITLDDGDAVEIDLLFDDLIGTTRLALCR